MPRTNHHDPLAGVARTRGTEHIGYAVVNVRSRLVLANRGQSTRAERVWRAPGAGRVDDCTRLDVGFAAWRYHPDHERSTLATLGLHLVEPIARDRDDTVLQPDACVHLGQCGERLQHPLDDVASQWQLVRVGRLPAVCGQHPGHGRVDVVAPGGEELHMTEVEQARPDRIGRFENQRNHAALEELRGSGQARRSCADDCNRELVI